jgi:glycosyltransferase involved in cell wall biosynthesis
LRVLQKSQFIGRIAPLRSALEINLTTWLFFAGTTLLWGASVLLAVGRPVVVSDLPTGVRMLVTDGVNGFRVPQGDARALAAAMRRIIEDPGEAERMGKAGRRLVEEQYTTEQMVNRYFRLYQEFSHA